VFFFIQERLKILSEEKVSMVKEVARIVPVCLFVLDVGLQISI
jgi:hypothetical protein